MFYFLNILSKITFVIFDTFLAATNAKTQKKKESNT